MQPFEIKLHRSVCQVTKEQVSSKEAVGTGFWYQEKENQKLLQPEENHWHRETITYKCERDELKVLKFHDNMIIKEVIDFSLQISFLTSALGMKNSVLRICHFAVKFGTLISLGFIEDIF